MKGSKRKIRKENLYLTDNRLGRNKMWYAADNYIYMCHTCADFFFFRFELDLSSFDKISNFHEIAPNFTYSRKS